MTKTIKKTRWQKLAGILTEASSPEAMQDTKAYFGSNDSVDGPYTDIVDDQPMDVDKSINKELVESTYPETASEYAQELNAKNTGAFKLVDEPEHWAKFGVHTGEELAKYLAIEHYHDTFKEVYGTRPRHKNFDKMSIEEIEAAIDSLYQEMEEEDDWEVPEGVLADDEPEDEVEVDFGKYDDLEAEWDEKIYGKK